MYIHLGEKEPVSFELNTMDNYNTLKFKIASPDSLGVIKNCGSNGEINIAVFAEIACFYIQYCSMNLVQNCQLSISSKKRLNIVIDKGKNGYSCDAFQFRDSKILPYIK